MRKLVIFITWLLIAVLGFSSVSYAAQPWPFYGQNLQNQRIALSSGVNSPALKWVNQPDQVGLGIDSRTNNTIAIGSNGTVYVFTMHPYSGTGGSTQYATVIAYDLKGNEVWRYYTDTVITSNSVYGTLAIDANNNVYIAVGDWNNATIKIYAIRSTGTIIWSKNCKSDYGIGTASGYTLGGKSILSSPDGTLYVSIMSNGSSYGGYLLAIDSSNGNLKWKYTCGICYPSDGFIAVNYDGTIYVISCVNSTSPGSSNLLAFKPDGSLKWAYSPNATISPVTVGNGGTIYFCASGKIYALNPDGSVKWSFNSTVGSGWFYAPTLSFDGSLLYVISNTTVPYTLNVLRSNDGTLLKSVTLNSSITLHGGYSPMMTVGNDGVLFIGDSTGNIWALDPSNLLTTGTLNVKWNYSSGNSSGVYGPSIVIDDTSTIYYRTQDGRICAVGAVDTTPLAVSSTDPPDGSTNVDVGTSIKVNFNKNIRAGTNYTSITISDTWGNSVNYGVVLGGSQLALTPVLRLNPLTVYRVTIPAGSVVDSAGNPLQSTYTFSFTTGQGGDTTPPSVTGSDPAPGALNVDTNKTVAVFFTENIQQGQNYGQVRIEDAYGTIIPTVTSIQGSNLLIAPSSGLFYGTTYTVVVPAGAVKDMAGNPLAVDCRFSFTTKSANGSGSGSIPVVTVTNGVLYGGSKDIYIVRTCTVKISISNAPSGAMLQYGFDGTTWSDPVQVPSDPNTKIDILLPVDRGKVAMRVYMRFSNGSQTCLSFIYDPEPPVVTVKTLSGATATSGSSINLFVDARDNITLKDNLQYSIDGTNWQPLPSDGVISAGLSLSGPNLIRVYVKDEAGNVGIGTVTVWKLV